MSPNANKSSALVCGLGCGGGGVPGCVPGLGFGIGRVGVGFPGLVGLDGVRGMVYGISANVNRHYRNTMFTELAGYIGRYVIRGHKKTVRAPPRTVNTFLPN